MKWNRKVYVGLGWEFANGDTLTGGFRVMPDTLRVAFDVEKTPEGTPNNVTVNIWNLNKAHRAIAGDDGMILVVKACYESDALTAGGKLDVAHMPTITVADVRGAVSRHNGGDWVTTINAGEGAIAYQTAYVNESLPPGAKVVDVFDRLVDSFSATQQPKRGFGLSSNFSAVVAQHVIAATAIRGGAATAAYSDALQKGVVLSGWTREIMQAYAERHDLVWFFDNNVLTAAPLYGDIGNAPLKLSPIIGQPERLEHGGVRFVTLLQAGVSAWTRQEIVGSPGGEFDGLWRVGRASYRGDTHGDDWYTTFEALPCQ